MRVLLENVSKFICGVFKVGASTTDLLQGIAEVLILNFAKLASQVFWELYLITRPNFLY